MSLLGGLVGCPAVDLFAVSGSVPLVWQVLHAWTHTRLTTQAVDFLRDEYSSAQTAQTLALAFAPAAPAAPAPARRRADAFECQPALQVCFTPQHPAAATTCVKRKSTQLHQESAQKDPLTQLTWDAGAFAVITASVLQTFFAACHKAGQDADEIPPSAGTLAVPVRFAPAPPAAQHARALKVRSV